MSWFVFSIRLWIIRFSNVYFVFCFCQVFNWFTIHLLTYLRTYLRTYFRTCLLTYLLIYLLPYVLTYLLTYLLIYLRTYLLIYLLTHSLTCSLTCLLIYLLTSLLTYLLIYLLVGKKFKNQQAEEGSAFNMHSRVIYNWTRDFLAVFVFVYFYPNGIVERNLVGY